MSEPEGDLLSAPMFTARVGTSLTHVSLPGALAALGGGEPVDFAALQPHQRHAWFAFVVQLAALGLRAVGKSDPRQSVSFWTETLTRLGPPEAFCLIVPDVTRPAFEQPPLPEGRLDPKRWSCVDTPDALDILVTAKNHDVKSLRIQSPRLEHWVYALVSLQTMQGFLGAGNYGIARMNGGFGNRPMVSVAGDLTLNARFQRDVRVWLDSAPDLVQSHGYRVNGGVGLVWSVPWDGVKSLDTSELDPCFIETCRRVRLGVVDGAVRAFVVPTKAARITGQKQGGDTGDVWTPIDTKRDAALTASPSTFRYDRLTDLLFEHDWKRGAAGMLRASDGSTPTFLAWAMVRGQGKTEGLHERELPISSNVRKRLGSAEGTDALWKRAQERIKWATTVEGILKRAIQVYLQGGPEDKLDFSDKRAIPFCQRFDQRVDARFFPDLFEAIEQEPDGADTEDSKEGELPWQRFLYETARSELEFAMRSSPTAMSRRWRAEAAARRAFEGSARRQLPDLFPKPESRAASAEGVNDEHHT
ncbi:MAG: type I-E CRISPR-associated protein Cse1/CasA [Deltaproteobacteria bacterium]|nr:type I-E CRISPR-associated protein Cse1/CasA [Deltaproteobacteria bacterium]